MRFSFVNILQFIRSQKMWLGCILGLSLLFNVCYNTWDLPGHWHHDERTIVDTAVKISRNFVKTGSLNPNFFAYPSLHIYLISFLIAIPLLTLRIAINFVQGNPLQYYIQSHFYSNFHGETYILARILAALMGTLTVFISYLISKRIFDKKVALLTALFLSITAGIINLSHFATVDIPACLWMSLSFYIALLLLEKKKPYFYALCGLSVGLAFSTKYTGILAFVPLFTAYIINTKENYSGFSLGYFFNKNLAILILSTFFGFVLATPYSIITFSSFISEFIKLNFYQPTYIGVKSLAFIPHLKNLFNIYGAFLFTISLLGFIYLLYLAVRQRNKQIFLLIITILAIYLKMGSIRFHPDRYIIMIIPFLTICAGKLCADIILNQALKKKTKIFIVILFSMGLSYTFHYSISGLLEFKNDDRKLAYEWAIKNIPNTAKIEISSSYGINKIKGFQNCQLMPYYQVKETYVRMVSNPLYKKVKKLLYWIDFNDDYTINKEPEELSLNSLLKRKPDYLILANRFYSRYLDDNGKKYFPVQHNLYSLILSGKTPYKVVADFRKNYNWLTPKFEFVNSGITIFKYYPKKEKS